MRASSLRSHEDTQTHRNSAREEHRLTYTHRADIPPLIHTSLCFDLFDSVDMGTRSLRSLGDRRPQGNCMCRNNHNKDTQTRQTGIPRLVHTSLCFLLCYGLDKRTPSPRAPYPSLPKWNCEQWDRAKSGQSDPKGERKGRKERNERRERREEEGKIQKEKRREIWCLEFVNLWLGPGLGCHSVNT